jgi:acetyltransferase
VASPAQIAPGDAFGGPATGMFQDPVFGPVLFWGAASPDSGDRVVALPPLNMKLGQDFLGRCRGFGLLANPTEAIYTVVKLSQLVCDFREITGIEIQLAADGVTALQVRINRAASFCDGLPLAVCPYPKELESTISLTDGRTMLLRPVRPEDEPAFLDFFARLSAEAVRFRFLHPIKHLPHRDAARLTQIDYDREMILVLEQRDSDAGVMLCGAVQVAADANHEAAEFAIVLRDDLTGLGLGPLMMRRMIEYARSRGIAKLHGDVLDDNRSMLRLCEVLGFRRRRDPDDPGIVKVGLVLEHATTRQAQPTCKNRCGA